MNTLKTPAPSKTRNSAIELLRIVAMLMIIMSHSSYHGGFPEASSGFFPNNFFLDWMILGNLGVDIYIIISGYFLSGKAFRPASVCRLLAQVLFYSFLGYGIHLLWGNPFCIQDLKIVLLPTMYKSYWFFTAYFVLLWLSPFLNLFLEHASRKQLLRCIYTMMILWCLVRSLTLQDMYGATMSQFVMFYLIGAYFRKYPDNAFTLPGKRYLLALGSFFLLLFAIGVYRWLCPWATKLDVAQRFHDPMSLLTAGTAIGMFAVAVNWKPFFCKSINLVASCTFGIYLLHDNPFVRSILWLDWIKNYQWFDSMYLLPRMLLSILLVFSVCCAVEWLRQKTVAEPMTRAAETVFLWGMGLLRKAEKGNIEKSTDNLMKP